MTALTKYINKPKIAKSFIIATGVVTLLMVLIWAISSLLLWFSFIRETKDNQTSSK